MPLDFPLSVWSRNFVFCSVSEGGRGLCFCCVFGPLSREGNYGLPSTPSNYSSSYGTRRVVTFVKKTGLAYWRKRVHENAGRYLERVMTN